MSDDLTFALVASRLAREIFLARKDAYGMDQELWSALTPASRAIFERQAMDILKAHAPIRHTVLEFAK